MKHKLFFYERINGAKWELVTDEEYAYREDARKRFLDSASLCSCNTNHTKIVWKDNGRTKGLLIITKQ